MNTANLLTIFVDLLRLAWRLAWWMLGLGTVVGLVALGVLVWVVARLSGRRPTPVRVKWPGRTPAPRPSDDTVVDVQAREVAPRSETLPGPNRHP